MKIVICPKCKTQTDGRTMACPCNKCKSTGKVQHKYRCSTCKILFVRNKDGTYKKHYTRPYSDTGILSTSDKVIASAFLVGIILLPIWGIYSVLNAKPEKKEVTQVVEQPTPTPVPIPRYAVFNERYIQNDRHRDGLIVKIVLSEQPTEQKIKKAIYSQFEASMYKYENLKGKKPYAVDIFAYASDDYANSGQWIGKLSNDTPNGRPIIEVNANILANLNKRSTARFGLTEAQRRAIWNDLCQAEHRANKETDYGEGAEALGNSYKQDVAKKLGIPFETLVKVQEEGVLAEWAVPAE